MSQKAKILAGLQSGKSLSIAVAATRYNMPTASVSKRVYDLAQDGYTIITGKNTLGTTTYTMVR